MPHGIIQSNQIANALGEDFAPTRTKPVIWRGLRLHVRPVITIDRAIAFVDGVMDAVASEDAGYHPEFADFAIRVHVLLEFAGVQLPRNTETQYEIVYGSDLYDTVLPHISGDQLASLRSAIDICLRK